MTAIRSHRTALMIGVAALFVLLVGATLLSGTLPAFGRGSDVNGTLIDSGRPALDFALIGPNGRSVRLSDFANKAVVLYFGYTSCPDVCPATLGALAQARSRLGAKADDVQVIMITVDPKRDSAERLAEYVGRFDPSFLGLTGDLEQLQTVASAYGIFFEAQDVESSTGYLVDHTSAVTVVDREGYIRLLLPFGLTSDQIAGDLRYLLDE